MPKSKQYLPVRKGPCYDNCAVTDKSGQIMFRCSSERLEWYLSRGLAKLIQEENPRLVQLLIEPKGPGNLGDPFYLAERHNRCVVCGAEEDLTLHHIVPHCYRKHMHEISRHSSHDVVPLCEQCHGSYELHASQLTQKMRRELGVPLEKDVQINRDFRQAVGFARVLLRNRGQVPEARITEIEATLRAFLQKDRLEESDITELARKNSTDFTSRPEDYVPPQKKLLVAYGDIQAFIVMWRRHFLSTMLPKYMPEYWDVNRVAK